jgi:hypothetical protein
LPTVARASIAACAAAARSSGNLPDHRMQPPSRGLGQRALGEGGELASGVARYWRITVTPSSRAASAGMSNTSRSPARS